MISIGLAGIVFVLAVIGFIFSLWWIYKGFTLALIPSVATVIIAFAVTGLSAFGRVGDIQYLSGITSSDTIVKEAVTTMIDPALVFIFGFVAVIMTGVMLFTVAQYVLSLGTGKYDESEDEYE